MERVWIASVPRCNQGLDAGSGMHRLCEADLAARKLNRSFLRLPATALPRNPAYVPNWLTGSESPG